MSVTVKRATVQLLEFYQWDMLLRFTHWFHWSVYISIHHYRHPRICTVFTQSKAMSPVCQLASHPVFSFTCTLWTYPLPWQKVHCPPRALRRRELQHFPVQHASAHSPTVQLSRRFVPVWHIPLLRLGSNVERSNRCFPPLITGESPVRVSSINRLTHSCSASSSVTHSLSHTRS